MDNDLTPLKDKGFLILSPLPSKTSRFAAIETLVRLQRTKYPVKPLLDTVITECSLPNTERGLAMNLVYGVLRKREYLDILIKQLCNRSIKKIDPVVYAAISTGLFQIFCLDKIPESAAVNETVNAVKAAKLKQHLQGFVNGVLRASIRQKESLPSPGNPLNSGRPVLNHPEWMTRRWTKQFGQAEMERICKINSLEPQLVLRVNSTRISAEELAGSFCKHKIENRPGQYAPDSIVLPGFQGSITQLPGYDDGFFQVQDEAAQLATLLLGPFVSDGNYLDACAGLGGKTSHILQLIHRIDARVVAIEPEPQRQRLLLENITRLFPGYDLTLNKSSIQSYSRTSKLQFTGVLVDAPCSGTGVTGRHPDIRWNRTIDDIVRYQLEQIDILEHTADLVAPDGILVYATCSLEPEENQLVVEKFLQKNKNFSITDIASLLPESCSDFIAGGYFQPHPEESIDGFFAARLKKTS